MSEAQLQRSIVKSLEAAGVWVIPVRSRDPGMPDLLLPEYGAWLRTKPSDGLGFEEAWDQKAQERGVRVQTVAGLIEAQLQVSTWQDETPKQNPSGWQKSRAKYVTRSAHLHVVR